MKRCILSFILGLIVMGGISVIAYQYSAKDITYTPSNSNWKVHDVKSAIDDLKNIGNKVRIVNIGEYDSVNEYEVNIKEKLPNDYQNLTINNFIIRNAQIKNQSYNGLEYENQIIDSYNNETGILKLNYSVYRCNSYEFFVNYNLACIIGNIEIEDIN